VRGRRPAAGAGLAARGGGGAREEQGGSRSLRRGSLRALPAHGAARARGPRQGGHELGAGAELREDLTMRLSGKVAFITGAGMGQGREGALLFAKQGARVAVADVNGDAAAETARLIAQAGGEALAVVGNVGVERDVERMIRETVARFGALHVLYNNAGVLWKDVDRSVLETSEESWD